MAPKAKTTKEAISEVAFSIVCEQGINALTAKTLAKRLNCSTQPIFWRYSGMNELIEEITQKAQSLFAEYLHRPIEGVNTYKSIGINYIKFAKEHKNLFKMLYMSEKVASENVLTDDKNMPYVLDTIMQESTISQADATKLFKQMWLFSHGIATMIATDTARFADSEIYDMLTDVYTGLLSRYKADKTQ